MKSRRHSESIVYMQLLGKLRSLYCEYRFEDVAFSILVLSLWLPNIASGVKHLFLYSILLSIDPESFSKKNHIQSYKDFKQFIKKIIPFLPDFPWIEDFVPETDWGDVKFNHNGRDYKIYYGCEIENIYDYLTLFQFLYSSRDGDYLSLVSRSPAQELVDCLSLQDEIISGITTQPISKKIVISPGEITIPPENFWKQSMEFFKSFNPLDSVPKDFTNRYSCDPGSLSVDISSYENFCEMVSGGSLLPYYFININNDLIPILPRRFSPILIEEWAKIFRKHQENLDEDGFYSKHLSIQIYNFLKKRIRSKTLSPFVCAISKEEEPHEIVFACSFISKNKLILIYSPAPFSSGEEIGKRLSNNIHKLREALELIASPPVTLGLIGHGQIVRYDRSDIGGTLTPELFIVLSQTSAELQRISFSEDLPGRIIFLDHFLGLFDEIEKTDEISDFLEYLEEIEPKLSNFPFGMLDKYGSFKASSGVLVDGAREPDIIALDPHWGSNKRYETLSKFWKRFPKGGYFDHPRSWEIQTISEMSVRLIARSYFGSAICCELANTRVFTTAPFDRMSYQQGLVSDLLMQVLEDIIRINKEFIVGLRALTNHNQIQINFFPWSLIDDNPDFKHLWHLNPAGRIWISDVGRVKSDVLGVRIVFDEKIVSETFEKAKDNSVEIELLKEVLERLDEFTPDPNLDAIKEQLEKFKTTRPRFKMHSVKKIVSFPEFVLPLTPSLHYLKEAAKKAAEFCKDFGFIPGEYELEEAETKLNTLRDRLVDLINAEINKYDFEKTIPYLIERIDALVFDYEREVSQIEFSLEHDVDYQREEEYSSKHGEFIRFHKAYRYLIEKFIQLRASGKDTLDSEQFQSLAALADKIIYIYSQSDYIHYDIYPTGIKVDSDFLMEVKYTVDLQSMIKSFGEEEARIRLGTLGNKDDRVISPRKVEEYLDRLDAAFFSDLGFNITSLVNVLQVLSQWPVYAEGVDEHTYYKATGKQISTVCIKTIEGINGTEIPLILDFLTLKTQDVLKLVGKKRPESDIPVWEYRKRSSRYNIRPLIRISKNYLWGSYSTLKSSIIWAQSPTYNQLPYDMGSPSIQNIIDQEKRLVEIALVTKSEEIIKRFTKFVEKNVDFYRRDKAGNHPTDLGDYDVLAYYMEKNIILIVEDKDILPPFCLKDAKRVREKIFGRTPKDDGYLGKIERREKYIIQNINKIAQFLKWNIDPNNPPRVVSLFVSRYTYWWTKFPPKETGVKFMRIDFLEEFIKLL
jgi:hypothetical protein